MNDLDLMGGVHTTADVPEDIQTALQGYRRISRDFIAQVVARKVLHRNSVRFLNAQKVVNTNDVLMGHTSGITQFADEPLDHLVVRCHLRIEEFQDELFINYHIFHEYYRAKPSLANTAHDAIALCQHPATYQYPSVEHWL